MKINNVINVKAISMGPIVAKVIDFPKSKDLQHFLESLNVCENRIRHEVSENKKIYFTKVCKILHEYFSELGFAPSTLQVKAWTEMDFFIDFIWDLDAIDKNYKDFYCTGPFVINFEYDNPVRIPEGWRIKNLTIWFQDFTSEEIL